MDVENSIMCQKDYVEFSANQKYCGNRTGSFVIRNSKAVIAFVTDDSNSGTGFSGTITALCMLPMMKPLQFIFTSDFESTCNKQRNYI